MAITVDFQVISTRDTNYLLIADMSEWDTILADPAILHITKPGTETPFEFDFVKGTDFNRFDSNDFEQILEVEDESFTSSFNLCVSLVYANLIEDSEVVTTTDDVTTYVKDTDYEMDYTLGTIKVLSTGSMADITEYYIDYQYEEDLTSLTDGIYTISLNSENDIFVKERKYLRTEIIRLELDKLIIELDIFNNVIDKETYDKITDIELLLKSAEANTVFYNEVKANEEYDKAVVLLERLNTV